MESKFDKSLKGFSSEQKEAIQKAGDVLVNEGMQSEETTKPELHQTPTAKTKYGEVSNSYRPKAELKDNNTAKSEHLTQKLEDTSKALEGVNKVKDSLAAYPASKSNESKPPQQEQDLER